jgi:pimeloyl-ACP methyl ester carboxylesterase
VCFIHISLNHARRKNMPKTFVHGNPETSAVWSVLFDELEAKGIDDLVALSPPGFGAPLPEGFEATQTGYRNWLIQQLEQLGGNVDLVGHDWGAGHVYGVLAERPDLLRSWAADCAGLIHPNYVWHDLALDWQTPDVGEESIAAIFGLPKEQSVELLASFGLPKDIASAFAPEVNDVMGECALSLYRSAAQPEMANLGERLKMTENRPGLVFIASEDPYTGTMEMCASVATDLGADIFNLEGLGHWWMFKGARLAADALIRHWKKA